MLSLLRPLLDRWRRQPKPPRIPGEIIDTDFLEPGGLDDAEFATILEVSEDDAMDILLGAVKIDEPLAEKLATVLRGTTPNYWLLAQRKWDAWRTAYLNESSCKGCSTP